MAGTGTDARLPIISSRPLHRYRVGRLSQRSTVAARRVLQIHAALAPTNATYGTIRLKLLKIGALVRRSVRRIKFAMASGVPWQNEFALAYVYLQRDFPR